MEAHLAWKRVEKELQDGTLPHELDRSERAEVGAQVREAEEAARDQVWASYRYVVLADRGQEDGIDVIDLSAGHASDAPSLSARIVSALKIEGRLNESVGTGYLDRKWPPALSASGAWPLAGLRQAFLDGSLGRLLDVEAVLRAKIPEFVARGDFGLASGTKPDGSYSRIWFEERVDADEVAFESDVFLLKKERAQALTAAPGVSPREPRQQEETKVEPPIGPAPETAEGRAPGVVTITLEGAVPPDVWNRMGTRLLPKLRAGQSLELGVRLTATVDARQADSFAAVIRQALEDLQLAGRVSIVSKA